MPQRAVLVDVDERLVQAVVGEQRRIDRRPDRADRRPPSRGEPERLAVGTGVTSDSVTGTCWPSTISRSRWARRSASAGAYAAPSLDRAAARRPRVPARAPRRGRAPSACRQCARPRSEIEKAERRRVRGRLGRQRGDGRGDGERDSRQPAHVHGIACESSSAWMRGSRVGASSSQPLTRPRSQVQVNRPESAAVGAIGAAVSQVPTPAFKAAKSRAQ